MCIVTFVSERNYGQYAQLVAGEVRAEMARQGKSIDDLRVALNFKALDTARNRYSGSSPYDMVELAQVAEWLGVPISKLNAPGAAA